MQSTDNISDMMQRLGKDARLAARTLATASTDVKNRALIVTADAILDNRSAVLAANQQDMEAAQEKGVSDALLDRLLLDDVRLKSISDSLRDIAALDDPVGEEIARWARPNGLDISRVRTPIGVIGVIYESRPNVTVDASALCLKSGNAAILRSGSDSFLTSQTLHKQIQYGLQAASLPLGVVQLVPTRDRQAVGEMLTMAGLIDIIVPRGGRSLVERVQSESRLPVFAHLEGICHLYLDKDSDLEKARDIIVNAKMRRTGICGALETLLVDQSILSEIKPILTALNDAGCEIRGDNTIQVQLPCVQPACSDDWSTEYLAPILSVKSVDGVGGAIQHIAQYSSGHTESIVTENAETAELFLNTVDSAIVMHNASTQFADGGEFGMGAEIGIATGRIHARGPVGLEQLTSFKYQVRGNGQVRP